MATAIQPTEGVATATFPRPWSHSRLEMATCPWRFWQHYVEKAPRLETHAMRAGKAVHEMLESAAAGGLAPVLDEIVDFARQTLGGFPVAGLIGVEEKLAVDRHWRPCDYDSPDAYFRGKLDVLQIDDATALVTDWKHSEKIAKAEGDPQLEAYAALVVACYPQVTEAVVRQANTKRLWSSPHTLDAEALDKARAGVDRRIRAAERLLPAEGEEPRALACSACNYCVLFEKCPMHIDWVAQAVNVVDAETAARAAGRRAFLEADLKRINAALNPWTAENGPVRTGDIEFGHFTAKKPEPAYDTEAVRTLLKGRDLEPDAWRDGVYGVNGRALRKLSKREDIADEAAKCEQRPALKTKFGARKVDAAERKGQR